MKKMRKLVQNTAADNHFKFPSSFVNGSQHTEVLLKSRAQGLLFSDQKYTLSTVIFLLLIVCIKRHQLV